MTTKQRINLTLNKQLYEKALRIMKANDYDNFSVFCETLIREAWEKKKAELNYPVSASDIERTALNECVALALQDPGPSAASSAPHPAPHKPYAPVAPPSGRKHPGPNPHK